MQQKGIGKNLKKITILKLKHYYWLSDLFKNMKNKKKKNNESQIKNEHQSKHKVKYRLEDTFTYLFKVSLQAWSILSVAVHHYFAQLVTMA